MHLTPPNPRRSASALPQHAALPMLVGALLATSCAAGGYSSYATVGPPPQQQAQAYGDGFSPPPYALVSSEGVVEERAAESRPGAQAVAVAGASGGAQVTAGESSQVAVDATRARDLRIYMADFVLAVFDVQGTADAVLARVVALGGYLGSRDDTTLVVRVPAARFEEAVSAVEGAGQVLQRNVRAEDVTEQYRDLETRIRTLDAMRGRLEAMLARATTIEEALAVERQLERVTVELESLRGRLRYLGDRVAYSTLTLRFRQLAPTEIPDTARPRILPFRWVQDLGLARLLDL